MLFRNQRPAVKLLIQRGVRAQNRTHFCARRASHVERNADWRPYFSYSESNPGMTGRRPAQIALASPVAGPAAKP